MKIKAYRGFSLIELLVSIAVLAVMAGLAFPVYQGVAKKARTTQAASNLRQCFIAFTGYVADHRGVLPGNEGGVTEQWKYDLLSYTGLDVADPNKVSIFGDPNHRLEYPDRSSEVTFAMSGFIGPKAPGVTTVGATRLTEITYPGSVVLLMQGKYFSSGGKGYFYPTIFVDTGLGFPPDDVYENGQLLVLTMAGSVGFRGLDTLPRTPYGPGGYFWTGLEKSWWPANWHETL